MPERPCRIRVDSSFKFEVQNGRYESLKSWAQLRIKKDSRRGDYCIDALIGDRGEKRPHSHLGINGDQSMKFLEPRGTTQSISKRVDDKVEGHLYTKRLALIDTPAKSTFTFTIIIDEPTRTIKLLLDEAAIEDAAES